MIFNAWKFLMLDSSCNEPSAFVWFLVYGLDRNNGTVVLRVDIEAWKSSGAQVRTYLCGSN